jgi:hypothetical protein
LDAAEKHLVEVVNDTIGAERRTTEELKFYRKMMSDLVDDYLVRRNPFIVGDADATSRRE